MQNNCSENLIFEITKELVSNNPLLNQEQIHNSISKIIVKYQVVKLKEEELECNLKSNIELYLSTKQLEGLSQKTLKGYKNQLNSFSKEIHKNVEEISTAHIRNYLSKFDHVMKSTLATKISIIKSFFVWLMQEEIIQKDPTKKLKTPKFNKHNPKYLNVDELEMLREACKTPRQRALVEAFYSSGCRLSEIQGISVKEIDFKERSTRVIGKGNKPRDVYFSVKAMYHIEKYLKTRSGNDEGLFVSERKPYKRLSNRGIQRELSEILKNAPIEKNVTVHSLRHTFTTLTLSNGCELSVVQALLGHSDPATTQLYYNLTDERKREQYKKHLVL